jgi:hypothetical protein
LFSFSKRGSWSIRTRRTTLFSTKLGTSPDHQSLLTTDY